MAKKKKKQNKLVGLVAGVLVVALVVILLVLFLIAPNSEKLLKKYESKDYAVVYVDQNTPLAGAGLKAIDVECTLTSGKFVVTYYEETEDAKEAQKSAEENKGEDTVVARRGNAVFVGSKEAAKIFKGQLG